MIAIWKKELKSYFYTPVGYVFMGVFLTLSGLLFFLLNITKRNGNIPYFFGSITYLWILLIPIITMRLFAEERQKKTDQLIFTSPVSVSGVVMGKFLAATSLLLLTVLTTGFYVAFVGIYCEFYLGEVLVAYTGFILQGLSFIAVNLFISSLAQSPTTAAIASLGVNLLLWLTNVLADNVNNAAASKILSFLAYMIGIDPLNWGNYPLLV